MTSLFDVPVDAAYHLVSALAAAATPLLGGLAAATAIVVFTMAVRLLLTPLSYLAMRGMDSQARMAPQVQALRQRHAGQPDTLQKELAVLYRAEGTTMFAGCLPLLLQWPLLSVMYLLFRSPAIDGAPNKLLSHDLFGAPLASHWLTSPGPFSVHGAIFAGLFILLAVIGWMTARMTRKQVGAKGTAGLPADQASAAAAAMTRFTPYLTVAFAAFLPLAAGLYLVTTSAWTLAERAILRRPARRAARPAAGQAAGPAAGPDRRGNPAVVGAVARSPRRARRTATFRPDRENAS